VTLYCSILVSYECTNHQQYNVTKLFERNKETSLLPHRPYIFKKIPRKTNQEWKSDGDEGGTPRLCEALAELLELARNRSVGLSLEPPRTRSVRISQVLVQNRFEQSRAIQHHLGNCKSELAASLRSAVKTYWILGSKMNWRF